MKSLLMASAGLALLSSLSGCVAAIPAVAALALGGTQLKDNESAKEATVMPDPVADVTVVDGAPVEAEAVKAEVVEVQAAEVEVAKVETPDVAIAQVQVANIQVADIATVDAAKAEAEPVDVTPADAATTELAMADLGSVPAPEAAAPLMPAPAPVAVSAPAQAQAVIPTPADMRELAPMPEQAEVVLANTLKSPALNSAALNSAAPNSSASANIGPSVGSRDMPNIFEELTTPDYSRFTKYVEDRSADFNLGRRTQSVVYNADSGLERPTFAQCGEKPLGIIFDIDNNGLTEVQSAAFWQGAIMPAPGLKNAVATARRLDVAVFYMSGEPADNGPDIQAILETAGLGPAEPGIHLWLKGERGLERKDLLRQVISRHYCVVAMAGDQRGDFAELYDFLRDPDSPAVKTLDPLFDAGWFILPNPFVVATPRAAK